jgi:hypothetical protein
MQAAEPTIIRRGMEDLRAFFTPDHSDCRMRLVAFSVQFPSGPSAEKMHYAGAPATVVPAFQRFPLVGRQRRRSSASATMSTITPTVANPA